MKRLGAWLYSEATTALFMRAVCGYRTQFYIGVAIIGGVAIVGVVAIIYMVVR